MRETHIRLTSGWRRALAATCFVVLSSATAMAGPIQRFDRFQAVADNGERLVAVGAFGAVNVSEDQGKSWVRHDLAGAPSLIGIATCGDGSFVALDIGGTVYRAGKPAAQWIPQKTPAVDALLDITCTASNRIWVVGARGALLSSADGGQSWKDQSLQEDIQLLNIRFPSASMGVISGEFGRVMVSRDGGDSWTTAGSLGESFYPYAMSFFDEKRGLATGIGGAVMETIDGGASWVLRQAPTEAPLYGLRTDLNGDAFVVGAGGSAFRFSGGTWSHLEGYPPTDLRGIVKTSGGTLVAGTGALVVIPAVAGK